MPNRSMLPIPSGVHVAAQMSAEPSEDELRFVRQMGVEYVVLWTDGAHSSADYYASRRELFEKAGLKIYGFGNFDVHNQDAIVLGLPERDEKIEAYKRHLQALGAAGIPYTTYAHMANGIWSTEPELTRGGAKARAFDLDRAEHGEWIGRRYFAPLSAGRTYAEAEIWENFAYFIRQVAPVAEAASVRIGIHPDDPPVPELAGVPRCIFSTYAGYQRALDLAASPNVGVCFCVGCWLEGGPLMGRGVVDSLRDFAAQGRLFKVHFRNVDRPLPHFVETFVDDGYMNMNTVMRTLVEIDFNGVVIPDHIPQMTDDRRVATAYTIGYLRALLTAARDARS